MSKLKILAASFVKDTRAATAIEYGLVATFISLACLVAIQSLGANVLTELYEQIVAAWS